MTIKETTLPTGEKVVLFAENPDLCAAIEKAYNIKVWPVSAPVGFISEDGVDGNEGTQYTCRTRIAGNINLEAAQDLKAIHGIDGEFEMLVVLIQEAFCTLNNSPDPFPNPFLGYQFVMSPIMMDSESFQPIKQVKLRWGEMDAS